MVTAEQASRKSKKKAKGFFNDFKAFISRGNVVDLAVGVIIGGVFSAIVTAVVNIFLSVCTWAVPGGLKGLVTPLPAITAAQMGVDASNPLLDQAFAAADIKEATIAFAANQGATITVNDASYITWQTALLSKYTLHGDTYYFNGTALIDWGTLINAVISFLIIAFVLFLIVRAFARIKAAQDEMAAKLQEEYYKAHPEERPAPVIPGVPAPTEMDVLVQIRDELKKQNAVKKE